MAKREIIDSEEFPAKQGNFQVGYKHPPKKYQFKPGKSGNPNGPPLSRCHLWRHVCRFMNLPVSEFNKIERQSLTVVEKTAFKIVDAMSKGTQAGSDGTFRMAKHFFDREEGKAVETIHVNPEKEMTDEEVNEVRDMLRMTMENVERAPDRRSRCPTVKPLISSRSAL
jgi:hypothetical protein